MAPQPMKYYIVDAFTDRPFGGNPAGVVLLGNENFPNEGLMQRIAAELRYSETIFVRQMDGNSFHARYFTPEAEVDLCGHATIAAFSLLHTQGQAKGICHLQTRAGDLLVEANRPVMMQTATPHIISTIDDPTSLYDALGINHYHPTMPVQVVSTGLPDIMLPLPNVDSLQALQPNMDAIARLTNQYTAISFHVFAISNDGYTAHVRDFAPACGIPEESATGTANASLTHYLATHGVIVPGDHLFLQGEAMGRPSIVNTHLAPEGDIQVGGPAVTVAEGNLFIALPTQNQE